MIFVFVNEGIAYLPVFHPFPTTPEYMISYWIFGNSQCPKWFYNESVSLILT